MIPKLRYVRGRIEEVIRHHRDTVSLNIRLNDFSNISPGQFIMVWLPMYEEIPLSPSYQSDSIIRITVRDRGETTHRINMMEAGEHLFLRGPYGRGFNLDGEGRYLLVGGGYGASPIIYAGHILADEGFEAAYVEGVKTSSQSLFIEEAEKIGLESYLVTEDGSSDISGLVTSFIEKIIDEYNYVLGCGPEEMLIELLKICKRHNVHCQVSVERLIKCGVGICGSCSLGDSGLLVCRDGPVFDMDTLFKSGYVSGEYD